MVPAHVYRMIHAGKFLLPLKLGEGTAAWLEEEIDRWLGGHLAERRKPAITRLTARSQAARQLENQKIRHDNNEKPRRSGGARGFRN